MDESKREAALSLAAEGFRVFPLRPNDRLPAIDKFPEKATTDPGQIARWWNDSHCNRNIGIATGAGLVVVDVDDKDNRCGSESLALFELFGDIATRTSITLSGGRHLFYEADPDDPIPNGVNRLGNGLDVRGRGGYVVAPGSTIDGKAYRWAPEGPAALAPLPSFLRERMGRARESLKKDTDPTATLDAPGSIDHARHFLTHEAPPAIEGAGGNDTTYRVACELKDMGLSHDAAAAAMLEVYNERCEPPWSGDDLTRIVDNAFRYGTRPVGVDAAVNVFQPEFGPLEPRPVLPFRPGAIPHRPWIVKPYLLRRCVSVLVAPPGAGKSTLTIAMSLAIISGREAILGSPIAERTRVWYYNNEDDSDEMRRRQAAAMQLHGLTWADLEVDGRPGFFVNSGFERRLKLATRSPKSGLLKPADVDDVIRQIKAHDIGLFVVDPWISAHDADENDNSEVEFVSDQARRIAYEANCAVLIVHHTRKLPTATAEGFAGNQDSSRGGGALMGVARAAFTLYGMSEKDADRTGIGRGERHRYARLDDAKGNFTLAERERWFYRESVMIGDDPFTVDGAPGDQVPEQEEVGALRPANLAAERKLALQISPPDIGEMFSPTEHRVPLAELARRLVEQMPQTYDGYAQTTIAAALQKMLESEPLIIEGWRYRLDRGQKKGSSVGRKVARYYVMRARVV